MLKPHTLLSKALDIDQYKLPSLISYPCNHITESEWITSWLCLLNHLQLAVTCIETHSWLLVVKSVNYPCHCLTISDDTSNCLVAASGEGVWTQSRIFPQNCYKPTTWPASDALRSCDQEATQCLVLSPAIILSKDTWYLVQLWLRFGGLGLHTLSYNFATVFIAFISSLSVAVLMTLTFSMQWPCFIPRSPCPNAITVQSVLVSTIHQRALSGEERWPTLPPQPTDSTSYQRHLFMQPTGYQWLPLLVWACTWSPMIPGGHYVVPIRWSYHWPYTSEHEGVVLSEPRTTQISSLVDGTEVSPLLWTH